MATGVFIFWTGLDTFPVFVYIQRMINAFTTNSEDNMETKQKKNCLECETLFVPKAKHQKFCNHKKKNCRLKNWLRKHPRLTNTESQSSR